ncbi:FAD-binding oxidoreductase [Bradyrhizobium septentrionale]|uniref:FAD-binding oxidoreductase n=1 Tax=Bradyrhizobium septentrionale TaxID=1404411 RepID=A0A973VU51_9BRAD|nr:FAD-binding oxidoreductase [Bradyrhizobium septentrionale]UGY19209.1 FAD-binding oxidoreductase [Bradyrhizobium septentrionale]
MPAVALPERVSAASDPSGIRLSGWGNYPKVSTELLAPQTQAGARDYLLARSGVVARGAGRAYGDAAIGVQSTISSRGLNRMRSFDAATARLTVEAGVTIADILTAFEPRGFFLKVVPGTKFVTVGGAIAADVHGKNHHRDGGFGTIVESFRLALPGGEIVSCSRSENAALFAATVGGMGLTGVILDATLRLLPIETAWLRQDTRVAGHLDAAIDQLESSASATYSVAWIDCLARGAALGRSLVYLAEHATRRDKEMLGPDLAPFPGPRTQRLSVPERFPGWLLNRASMRAFNELYFRRGAARQGEPRLVHWDPYFFPLDAIADWNRIYGRRGFVQYQCVIPLDRARRVLAEILDRVSRRGDASFLAVLKQLGDGGGPMSFPLRGYTLTMDFPVTDTLFAFLDQLDALVVDARGRLYLAKDARQSRATFESGYPGLAALRDIRRQTGANTRLASHLSARLGI